MDDCLFCKIVAGEIPADKVYEDGEVLAFLDINPTNPGHTLVIPKEHYPDLAQTPSKVASSVMAVIPSLAKSVMKAVEAPAFNMGVNNGAQAGQMVFHTHFHIVPRFENDGYQLWKGKPYESPEVAKEIADKIRLAQK